MRITHAIRAGSFLTNLECVMRIRDDVKGKLPINTNKKHALSPYMLKNSHKLVEIEAVLPFLSFIEPNVDLLDKCKNVDFTYTMFALDSGITNTLKKQLKENAFVIKEDKDRERSGIDAFVEELEKITGPADNIVIKEQKKDDIVTIEKKYRFAKNKKYFCFIKGKNFLILEEPKSDVADKYFDLVLTKFEPPKKEATKDSSNSSDEANI